MKNLTFPAIVVGCLSLTLTSCGAGSKQENDNKIFLETTDELNSQKTAEIPAELLGNYHGIQAGYNLKNQYGDDVLINGNKIAVPSSDFKFLLKEKNIVNLQQTNLEDNSRVFYDGTYIIISETDQNIKIECTLSDGQTSNPTYTLSLNKTAIKGMCNGSKEPSFPIEKE